MWEWCHSFCELAYLSKCQTIPLNRAGLIYWSSSIKDDLGRLNGLRRLSCSVRTNGLGQSPRHWDSKTSLFPLDAKSNNGPTHAWKATQQRRCQRYVFLLSISQPTTHLFPGWAGPTNHPHGWNKSHILIQLSVVFIWQLKSFSVVCSAQGIYFFLNNVLVLLYYI